MKKGIFFVFVLFAALATIAAKPSLTTHFNWLWIGDRTATSNVTVGENDAYINGTLEVDGAARFDGGISGQSINCVDLPLASFVVNGVPITNATGPNIEIDDLVPGIVWADGETTPAQISFMVPTGYISGGTFKILATESNSATPNQIDFSVYINSDGVIADSAATNQTPVALAGTLSTPDLVTLTVATDFASLAANQVVTLNIWRDNVAAGTGDLEIKNAAFCY